MNKSSLKFKDIDGYHSSCSAETQKILQQLRLAIKQAAPKAAETISYGMPAFRQNKTLVYYAVHKEHIGFYPTPKPIVHFKKELKNYKTSKGAIQFSIKKPLPLALIKKIVRYRAEEDMKISPQKSNKNPNKLKTQNFSKDILSYHAKQTSADKKICDLLYQEICNALPEAEYKVWHGHPVWFLDGNPIVGYSKEKRGLRLMFWSGADFSEKGLGVRGGKFKDASVFYSDVSDINTKDLKRWLKKSKEIQWDYKNIVKRKGVLRRLK